MSWCGGGEIRPTPGVLWRMLGDSLSTLWPGSWPPSPGLAPWAILICSSRALHQVFAGHAEPAAGHLLDGAGAAVAVGVGLEAGRVFAPFAGVAAAADAVHGDGQRLVRFARDRAVGHGAGGEPLDDLLGRLDFLERNRRVGPA